MSIPDSWKDHLGSWKGTYKLHRSWLEGDKKVVECKSSLHLDSDPRRAYATLVYTWEVDGDQHESTMLLCYSKKAKRMEIGWSDSWHQNTGVFFATGPEADDGSFLCKGSYKAGDQTWGWTISIAFAKDRLIVKMDNVEPGGKADWAVDSAYKRDA